MAKKKETETSTDRFSKNKILSSSRYAGRNDLLHAILENDREYTIKEVNEKINQFMKGKVEEWH